MWTWSAWSPIAKLGPRVPAARSARRGPSSPAGAGPPEQLSVIVPGPWLPSTGTPLIIAMSTALPKLWLEMLPLVVMLPCAAVHRGDRQPEALLGEVGERGQQAPVDLAGADFDPGRIRRFRAVRRRARGAAAPPWGAAGPRRRRAFGEGALALGAVDRRRLEQLPAVEDRLRVDPRRPAPGRPDREVDVGVDAVGGLADPDILKRGMAVSSVLPAGSKPTTTARTNAVSSNGPGLRPVGCVWP